MINQLPNLRRDSVVYRTSDATCRVSKGLRAESCQFRFIEREAGDELLRLQAKYARAYAVLQNHERNCPHCRLASRMEARDSENSSATLFDNEMRT